MARALVKEIKDTRKNYIINGDMRISQRGTLFTSIATDTYSLDRWLYRKSGTMVHSISKDTDVPTVAQAGYAFQNSLLAFLSATDTSIGATDFCTIQHRIEGYNWANIAQKITTLSFWIKSSQTGTFCVGLVNSNGDRSTVLEYTVNSANTWEYKTLTFPASPSTGTWDYTTGIGVSVCFTLAAGTNFQTTAGSWNTTSGGAFATSNQVNACNTISTNVWLTGVCLNEGSAAIPFQLFANGNITGELTACQRYYEKSYALTVNPGTPTGNEGGDMYSIDGPAGQIRGSYPFKVEKRAVPSVQSYDANGTAGRVSGYNGAWVQNQVPTFFTPGVKVIYVGVSQASGTICEFHMTASAEL